MLVGTVTIEKSEQLSKLLKARGIKHEVLNAKNRTGHARQLLIQTEEILEGDGRERLALAIYFNALLVFGYR